ncbi:hypothetical protein P154DRAFT_540076 [Amniculicola lignicola CBS 123094]|uniref:Uncharacterized protein n=1 Tax=Amniculicola lignicola CBS 123094 TaxID=1392246 RepID=A0A6A5VWS5_9PLEO|nr:hypothetical protein P154DRAFT_540076 [Amniculicola lignicola CBS 123094]
MDDLNSLLNQLANAGIDPNSKLNELTSHLREMNFMGTPRANASSETNLFNLPAKAPAQPPEPITHASTANLLAGLSLQDPETLKSLPEPSAPRGPIFDSRDRSQWYLAQNRELVDAKMPKGATDKADLCWSMAYVIIRRVKLATSSTPYIPPLPPKEHELFPYWVQVHEANEYIDNAHWEPDANSIPTSTTRLADSFPLPNGALRNTNTHPGYNRYAHPPVSDEDSDEGPKKFPYRRWVWAENRLVYLRKFGYFKHSGPVRRSPYPRTAPHREMPTEPGYRSRHAPRRRITAGPSASVFDEARTALALPLKEVEEEGSHCDPDAMEG